ncbi:unnamed protein product [Gongylonema pulchrum]|uniref:C3H1-type domain-containing protein n=1 Tax=Gongylonema pulchrum TaxID=637853 RepID=A0A183E224_9BILA|nr:unnamed protein product [Gongylonema pulchrum]
MERRCMKNAWEKILRASKLGATHITTNNKLWLRVKGTLSTYLKNTKLYKTELCRSWMECGRCNYGDKCQYAHGEEERRPVHRHPKYKTAYCQPFHQVGYCSYGSRCHFIHNEEPASLARYQKNNTSTRKNTVCGGVGGTGHTAGTAAATLAFGMWHPYCNSAGDSPVPSSADSNSDSPITSTSPTLDFDENMGALATTGRWGGFGGSNVSF